MNGTAPEINQKNPVINAPIETSCAAKIALMARRPFLSPSSLSSPPAVMAISATARVSSRLSCSITSSLRMPLSNGGGRASPLKALPAIVQFVGGSPDLALETTKRMRRITHAESRVYQVPALGFRGTPTGIDVLKVVEIGIVPAINTGIAHRDAGVGQVGAGLVRPPMEVFEAALIAYAERYGI